jgi:hypothetical protein
LEKEMSNHTSEPWTYVEHKAIDGGDYIQILAGSWDIAHNRHSARDWEEERANGRLMTAAPKLYRILAALIASVDKGGFKIMTKEALQPLGDARWALAEARGQSSLTPNTGVPNSEV